MCRLVEGSACELSDMTYIGREGMCSVQFSSRNCTSPVRYDLYGERGNVYHAL